MQTELFETKPPQVMASELTPVEKRGGLWFKRDDEFCIAGVRGGKVRTCWKLSQGAKGLVTAGSRASPQVNIVASIALELGVPCRVHTPEGELSPEVQSAKDKGAVVVQHRAGYNNVIIARAREDAKLRGWTNIPFGMECQEAVEQTRRQVVNLPNAINRLIVPCGSGMSLAGILYGLKDQDRLKLPVLAVVVGSDPTKRLNRFAPGYWREQVQLLQPNSDYHSAAKKTVVEGLILDPIYEAKTIPFLLPGDCLWVVGIRATLETNGQYV